MNRTLYSNKVQLFVAYSASHAKHLAIIHNNVGKYDPEWGTMEEFVVSDDVEIPVTVTDKTDSFLNSNTEVKKKVVNGVMTYFPKPYQIVQAIDFGYVADFGEDE